MGLPCRAYAVFLLAAFFAASAAAQDVPRVRGTIASFDGTTLAVTTDDGESLSVAVLASTVYIYDEKKSLADIQRGDFVGVTADLDAGGALDAEEVHIFPGMMRGAGEGHYPMGGDAGRIMTAATVTRVGGVSQRFGNRGQAQKGSGGGMLALHYRGADEMDGVCMGRAPLPPLAWTAPPADAAPDSGCTGDIQIKVGPDVPVVALVPGDKSLLVPGAAILMFVATGPDGKKVTPGLSVEKDGFKPLV